MEKFGTEKACYIHDFKGIVSDRPLFLICSIIHPPDIPLWGKLKRSFFSDSERLEQTIETCNSIKNKFSDANLLLLEFSELSLTEIEKLSPHVTKILLYSEEKGVKEYREHSNRSFGELFQLSHIVDLLDRNSCTILFKISGRYRLCSDFNIENFSKDKFTFREATKCYYTVIYSVPGKLIDRYKELVKNNMQQRETMFDIEHSFYELLDREEVETRDEIGCEGNLSVNGEYILI